ncbi:MAG: hypothetical protein R3D00_24570 [Bacteroidia bacterium]
MDKKDSTNPQLEAYLENQLSPEEKKEFEKELEQNVALSEELLQYRQAYAALKVLRHNDLLKEVQNYSDERRRAWRKSLLLYSGIAASLLILVFSAYGFAFSYSNGAIFDRYFSPYVSLYGTLRSQGNDDSTDFFRAMKAYSERDYSYSIKALRTISPESVFYKDAQLYLANALMALKQYREAQQVLEDADVSVPQVGWYLGLSLLATEDSEKAQKVFEALRQNPKDDFYQKKADLVLSDLHSPLRRLPGMVYH